VFAIQKKRDDDEQDEREASIPVLDVDEVDDVEDGCKEGDQTYSPVPDSF
jgi:hypothetical protein